MLKHLRQQIETINDTFQNYKIKNSEKLVNDCISTLKSGNRIIATAIGKNVSICEKFIGTLNSLGIDSHFLNTNSAVHGDLGLIKKNDVVIMLSKSGETSESIYLSKFLNKKETTNWLITCNNKGTLKKRFKNSIVLPIRHEGDPWNLIPNNSTLIFLIFLQALAMEIIEQLQIPLSTLKENHPGGGIGKNLKIKQ